MSFVAGLECREQRRIPRDELIVISITGNGYMALEVVAPSVEKPFTIDATLDPFDALLDRFNSNTRTQATGS
ncbi:MAG: Threonine synthase [Deltaproteobacteria bacterium]|nr:Threonine synthase [Deltaproteobacteria bacterium]